MTIQFQGHIQPTVQWHTFKTFMFVFINSCSSQFFFVKYLINIELTWLSVTRYNTSQNFHMAWHVILCSIGYIDVPNKGIGQGCSWASCDIHISPFSKIYALAFSNVLLVLALNFMAHKSSYCKCSLAWCQMRTFLLFTIWTLLLQMREYLLRYAGTDRIKKSHYNTFVMWKPVKRVQEWYWIRTSRSTESLAVLCWSDRRRRRSLDLTL